MLRAALATLVVMALLAAAGESHAQTTMTIRVYDVAGGPTAAREAAIAAAAAIFEQTGFSVIWRDCTRDGADYPCTDARGPRDLVVRIVPNAIAATVPAGTSVTADGNAAQPALRLGFAAVTSGGRAGVVATVYRAQVRQVAERAAVAFELLLGRAIAHEIGHLLPGGDDHGRTGLMRPVWTDEELRRNQPGDWLFAPALP